MSIRDEYKRNMLLEEQKTRGLNRRKAIMLYCLLCSGDEPVRKCSCNGCALYPFRTGRGKQDPIARDEAIKKECMYHLMDSFKAISECCNYDCPLYPYKGYTRKKKMPKYPEK